MKHTPGPWRMHKGDEPYTFNISGDTNVVRNVYKEANAHFITRACNSHYDLLKACKDAIRTMEIYGTANMGFSIDQCKQAIAKAEGE